MSRTRGSKNKPVKAAIKRNRDIKKVVEKIETVDVDEILNLDDIGEVISLDDIDENRNTIDNVVEFSDGIKVPKYVAEKMIPYTQDKSYQPTHQMAVFGAPVNEIVDATVLENTAQAIVENVEAVKKSKKSADVADANFKLFKEIYLLHPEINDSFENFCIKFRYFLISHNLDTLNLTVRNILRMIKLYPNLDLLECKHSLGLD